MAVHGARGGAGEARASAISHETDRARFIGRGRSARAPQALIEQRAAVGHRGLGARSDRRDPLRDHARRPTRRSRSTSSTAWPRRATACVALVEKYQDRRLADRVFELAWTHSQVVLRQLNASEADAQLYARLAGAVIYANADAARRRQRADAQPPRPVGSVGLRDLGRPADRAAADRQRRTTSSWCASSCRRMRTGASRAWPSTW